jgi:hypothetical protein
MSSIEQAAAAKQEEIHTARQEAEAQGVTIEGVRYAGDDKSRWALNEARDFAQRTGMRTFSVWLDADEQYHPDHPASEVHQAALAMFNRRAFLIDQEARLMAEIDMAVESGDAKALQGVAWPSV